MSTALRARLFRNLRSWGAYAALLGAGVAAFLWIAGLGARLEAPTPASAPSGAAAVGAAGAGTLMHVLLALCVILFLARAAGVLFRRLRQPPVIGEVVVGIALGPSLLGHFTPQLQLYLLPPAIAPLLGVLAQIGVILFLFAVGLELDLRVLRSRAHSTLAISHASIVLPFLLGSVLALWLYPRLSSSVVPFQAFALFLGVSMSVTAFPVLARILTDRDMQRSRLGVLALTCAAIDDVSAWCLLAFVVSVVRSQMQDALQTLGLVLLYLLVMIALVRPWLKRFVARHDARGLTRGVVGLVVLGLLLSALATEAIGIHALFGAFLFGALIPHDSRIARELVERVESLTLALFLPAFFAFTGLRTEIGLVGDLQDWFACGLIVLVATAGKFGGSFLAARATGLGARDAAALGVLMNTRGLMELIVLNVGLELGILSPKLFAMLVIMAVVTTLATTPVIDAFGLGEEPEAGNLTARHRASSPPPIVP